MLTVCQRLSLISECKITIFFLCAQTISIKSDVFEHLHDMCQVFVCAHKIKAPYKKILESKLEDLLLPVEN